MASVRCLLILWDGCENHGHGGAQRAKLAGEEHFKVQHRQVQGPSPAEEQPQALAQAGTERLEKQLCGEGAGAPGGQGAVHEQHWARGGHWSQGALGEHFQQVRV